jgi:hypothetical protein
VFTEHLELEWIRPSIGSVGDAKPLGDGRSVRHSLHRSPYITSSSAEDV